MRTRTVTQADVDAFGLLSGATGLIHTEPAYAATTRFGATLVPGIMLAALIQQELPAGWTALELQFTAPVRVGVPFWIVMGPERGGVLAEIRTADGPAVFATAQHPG